MFRWYRNSEICFTYLADVEVPLGEPLDDAIKGSKWFTRGWTLQELIAPKRLVFYDKNWRGIGDKQHFTTLLEIFDINMPLLYGEGEKAFLRLQEEIINEVADQTIFAWSYNSELHLSGPTSSTHDHGMLSRYPSMFQDCGGVKSIPGEAGPYNITNKGLRIELPILQHPQFGKVAILACYFARSKTKSPAPMLTRIAIPIEETRKGDGSFGRQPYGCPFPLEESEAKSTKVHIIYLLKHDFELPIIGLGEINQLFIGTSDKQTILLKAIWAPKPVTDLTEYCSWVGASPETDSHTNNARRNHIMDFEFRTGNQDYVVVLLFKHIGGLQDSFHDQNGNKTCSPVPDHGGVSNISKCH